MAKTATISMEPAIAGYNHPKTSTTPVIAVIHPNLGTSIYDKIL
ncbi:MAG: hypothetical protein VKO01_03430 [Cyanobacteriota bacterium]|nr:hypothetical protein [Cyanobacteriota bacterium]